MEKYTTETKINVFSKEKMEQNFKIEEWGGARIQEGGTEKKSSVFSVVPICSDTNQNSRQ